MSAIPVTRDTASAAFFDGTARGELLLRQCEDCDRLSAPRTETCPSCGSAHLAWTPAHGTGTLVSWTVVPGRAPEGGEPPRVIAGLVELAEGPWLHARIVGIAPEDARVGLPLAVGFHRPEDGESVPVFSPFAKTRGQT